MSQQQRPQSMIDQRGKAKDVKLFAEAASRGVTEVSQAAPNAAFMVQLGVGIVEQSATAVQVQEQLKRFKRWVDEFADDQVLDVMINIVQSPDLTQRLYSSVAKHYGELNPPPPQPEQNAEAPADESASS